MFQHQNIGNTCFFPCRNNGRADDADAAEFRGFYPGRVDILILRILALPNMKESMHESATIC